MGFWNDRSVLITGGAGLIGSAVAKKLVQKGAKVKVLDNFSAYPFDQWKRFGLDTLSNVDKIDGDIRDKKTVERACKGLDFVFHEAAYADVAATIENPDKDFRSNVEGTFNLLEAIRKNDDIERFVFASSAAVYGERNAEDGEVPTFKENMEPDPISTYGNSKLWGERECLLYHDLYGIPSTSLRYFSVYGVPQVPKKGSHSWVVAIFAMRILKEKPLKVFGDGTQVRDFTHIDDIAEATILAAEENSTIGEFFNVGTGKPTSINQLARLMLDVSDSNVSIEHEEKPEGDPMGGYADTTKMEKLIDWRPVVNLKEGIERYWSWIKTNRDYVLDWI